MPASTRPPIPTPARIPGPNRKLFISKHIREQAALLPATDRTTDFCSGHGLPYVADAGVCRIDLTWLRSPEFLYDADLHEFCCVFGYGESVLDYCNARQKSHGYFNSRPEVHIAFTKMRKPAHTFANFPIGCAVVKKLTNERLRVMDHEHGLIWPWRKDIEQTMFCRHIDETGAFETHKPSGYLSNSQVRVCSDLDLQPRNGDVQSILLSRMSEALQAREESAEQSLDFLLSKMGGRVYTTLSAGNVKRLRDISQDIPCALVDDELEARVNKLCIPITYLGKEKSRFEFSVSDVEDLKSILDVDCLHRQSDDPDEYFFVVCTPSVPVKFEYNYVTSSQKLRVIYEVDRGNAKTGVVHHI